MRSSHASVSRVETTSCHRLFCGDEPPEITSLHDLQAAFGLEPERLGGVSGSALAGHSTSLTTRSVSAINPRAILFRLVVPLTDESVPPIELVALAFTRGEQFVELVRDRDRRASCASTWSRFEQACNERAAGCTPGDLLTEAIERDWREVTLYDEAVLENTVLDCATCHQPDGPGTPKILRMQEFEAPWTHWFFSSPRAAARWSPTTSQPRATSARRAEARGHRRPYPRVACS